ncbi:MAG: hypothetical protein DIU67_003480 [Actinomycetes bacterium]|nr:MAG: hypothetical protein DIU67_01345 [Actinomycetota bacterium]
METLSTIAMLVAVVAAIRGTWSPCGVSMLSSITPLTESGRGNRYWRTVAWFVLGTLIGGSALGLVAAGGAWVVARIGFSTQAALTAGLVGALVTLISDLGPGGWRLPSNPRQVNRTWLDRYRSWVYGIGFGAQLGVGVATFVMSATVYLMVVLTSLTGRPLFAFLTIVVFGFIRGLAILPGARVKTPVQLVELHQRIERYRPHSRALAVATQVVVIGVFLSVLTTPVAGAATGLVLAGVVWAMRKSLRDPAPKVRQVTATVAR